MGQVLTHIVCKPFGDDMIDAGDPLQKRLAGECVNALFWRTTERMEGGRFIVPMPDGVEPVSDTFGRYWSDLDMLIRAEREPLRAEVESTPTVAVNTEPDDTSWIFRFDPEADDLDWNELTEYGFPFPRKTSERRYQLWNGQVVVGIMTEAADQHYAGVRARIRELRAEHLAPAAGSATQ